METTSELIAALNDIGPWDLKANRGPKAGQLDSEESQPGLRENPPDLEERLTAEELESLLAEKLNAMIRDDFGGLVQLLYRIDVEEPRLRYLLQQHKGEDAGRIIARLIIDRLLQKIETRRQYSARNKDIPDDEKW